ncbi:MAG: molybdenum cofactor biosynthesis protein MoaE [Pseudomonadota bacterium]
MTVEICARGFSPYERLASYERDVLGERCRAIGASASFIGSMRDHNEGEQVLEMTLEHYPGMTEQHLESIGAEAQNKWGLDDFLIVHRTGEVVPGDPIVLVAVWARHRAHAFDACRFIMEDLKSKAPFWKKELTGEGERWVTNNTPGTTEEFEANQ